MGEIIENIPNILSIIAIISGVISIKVAKDSLRFSQRSMLIKESYEPILNDIRHNRKIEFETSKEMSFSSIKKITESYVFPAFEEQDRELISSILKAEEKINSFKQNANSYAGTAVARVFNEELRKRNIEEIIDDVKVGDSKGNYNREGNLYDILLGQDLSVCIASNSPIIWCETGYNYTALTPEGDEYESFDRRYQRMLTYIIEKHLGININLSNLEDDFFSDFKEYEERIVMELKRMPKYKIAEKEYEDLLAHMNKLEGEIIGRIRELIIP